MQSQLTRFVLVGALALSPVLHAEDAEMASVDMLTGACVACHGQGGNSAGPAIPSLASLPSVYFIGAMLSYKHVGDLEAAEQAVASDPALEDVVVFPRNATIMNRLAGGYTLAEIKAMAHYFEELEMAPAEQGFDEDMALEGEVLHADNCEKCHEDGGRSTEDDMVPLAGQWQQYLHYALDDFHAGARGMPKKMKSRLKEVVETGGEENLANLIHYYASQQ